MGLKMRGDLIVLIFIISCLTIVHCHAFAGDKKAVRRSIAFGSKRYKPGKSIKWNKKPVEMMYDSKDNLYMLCTDGPSSSEEEEERNGGMLEMYMLEKGEDIPVKLKGTPEANINEFNIDKNDNIYMATDNGVYTYDADMGASVPYALPGENVTGIYTDHNSKVYVQEAKTSNVNTLDKGKKVPFKKVPKCDDMIISKDNTIYTMNNGTVASMKEDEDKPNVMGQFDQKEVLGMYLLNVNLFVFLTRGVVFCHLNNPTRFTQVRDIVSPPICMAGDSRNNIALSFWFDDLTTLILI